MSVEVPPELTLESAILMAIDAGMSQIWTALPGRVVSFDAATQRATVQPTVSNVDPVRALPAVVVPVSFPRAGGYLLTLPVNAGDTGVLVFSALSAQSWLKSGTEGPPQDTRRHISPICFLPGVSPSPVANYPTSRATIGKESNLSNVHPVALGDRLQAVVNLLDNVIRAATPPGTEPAFLALKNAWLLAYPTTAPDVSSSDVQVTDNPI